MLFFSSDFNCDTTSGHPLPAVGGHWVWTGENASEEAEEPDQHPWQSEEVCGLSQATLASEHHGRFEQQSSTASGGPLLTSTRDTVGQMWRQKGSRDWHQNLILGGNPKNVFLSSFLKSLLSFCPPLPLALESLSYNRKIVSLLLFAVVQHWAPFPEQVFKLILKRDCFPMRQWGGRCALWHAMACLLALLCSKSKLGMPTETNSVSLLPFLALGDTVFFLFFSGERDSHIQH